MKHLTSISQTVLAIILLSAGCSSQVAQADPPSPLNNITYVAEQPLIMNMGSSREVTVIVTFNKMTIPVRGADTIGITFKTSTISPQFNILSLSGESIRLTVTRKFLEGTKYQIVAKLKLHANYIGHALLQPASVEFVDATTKKTTIIPIPQEVNKLPVTIVQFEGIWGIIFIISVSVLIIISYINLGAQLDGDNMRLVVKKPKTLVLGSIISVLIMPMFAWFVGIWLFRSQPLFRIGSFIFASGPAASASTLWTVMLNSDKELSVGLQVISTVAALVTMPLFLYMMEQSLDLDREMYHHIKVPYARLIQTLLVLLAALLVGWRLGRHKRAREVSAKIFKPLVFFVLIFIIVFSSILYWHVYQMFDWNITLASMILTMTSYLVGGLLGFLINCDLDRAVAISITSAYKNSGIAFAVLLVAFEAPDTYIAYVPCLTQVVTTSLTLYLTYALVTLVNFVRRRGQPASIQATSGETEAKQRRLSNENTPASAAAKKDDVDDEENDEFIALNVTDIEPDSLASSNSQKADSRQLDGHQTAVKMADATEDNDQTAPKHTTV